MFCLSLVDLVQATNGPAPQMLGRMNASDRIASLLTQRGFEREMLLTTRAPFQVPLELDLRRRIELTVYERTEMTSHELATHDFSAFLERNASSGIGSSTSPSPSSMMPSCTAWFCREP